MANKRFSSIPQLTPMNQVAALRATTEALSHITGQKQGRIQPLESTATTAEIVAKVNEIISRLQGT